MRISDWSSDVCSSDLGAFSNLYRREIEFEGEMFATSEHAYQAGKPRKQAVRDWLMNAPSPALLAMAAHGLYYWDVAPGWSSTKFDRMRAEIGRASCRERVCQYV